MYAKLADVFSPDLTSKLFKYIGINNRAIKLVNGQQILYGLIYSLKPVELEILKAYIKTNLANGFIRTFKSFTKAPIFFDQKSNDFLWLCFDHRGFNNLTIKNRYLLLLVKELLDRLERASKFTQLDLTSAYYRLRICKKDK